jgi:hypothetical protein
MDHEIEPSAVDRRILRIRGQSVMLDTDLALIYRIPTFHLNQAVKRNRARFPSDFMFRLTEEEKAALVANHSRLEKLKFSPSLPAAFTEHGAVMLASVLKSPIAVAASIEIVRAFNRMRRMVAAHKELAAKLAEVEGRLDTHDVHIQALFTAIRRFLDPPPKPNSEIGFKPS